MKKIIAGGKNALSPLFRDGHVLDPCDNTPDPPYNWDGDLLSLPNLVALWHPEQGAFSDREGTTPAAEGDTVLAWRDAAANILLEAGEGTAGYSGGILQSGGGAIFGSSVGGDGWGGTVAEVITLVGRPDTAVIIDQNDTGALLISAMEDGGFSAFRMQVGAGGEMPSIALPCAPGALSIVSDSALSAYQGDSLIGSANYIQHGAVGFNDVIMMFSGLAVPTLIFSAPLPNDLRRQVLAHLESNFT